MKKIIITILTNLFVLNSFGQTDSLLNSLQVTFQVKQELFPKKMLFTQRWAWGEHGFMRKGVPVTPEIREHDMLIRRKMLIRHQQLGYITLGGMVAQGIVGPILYNNQDNSSIKSLHEALGLAVNVTYSLTAIKSLFAPPPMLNRDKGITSIRLHKWLAIAHLSGMIATNILASQTEDHPNLKSYHRSAAYFTFASFAAAVFVIKL